LTYIASSRIQTTRFPDSVLAASSVSDLFALREAFTAANRNIDQTERPLTKWVQALDSFCLAAEGRSTPARELGSSLDLLRGSTQLSKRQVSNSALAIAVTGSNAGTSTIPMEGLSVPFQEADLLFKRNFMTEQTALLETVIMPDMEEYLAYFEQSWTDLFPQLIQG
jgi:hypothetical protein